MPGDDVYKISNIAYGASQSFELKDLLLRAKAGQDEAIGQIYELFFEKIYRFTFYRVSHKEVAEDLTEEVFIKAFGSLHQLTDSTSFEGWLYQIARNKVIDYYRSKKLIVPLEAVENTLEYETNLIDLVDLQAQQKVFIRLLKELKPEQQIVIKLKFLENLDNSAIAELLHKNEGAIRVIQHRAIAKLKELIEKFNAHHD